MVSLEAVNPENVASDRQEAGAGSTLGEFEHVQQLLLENSRALASASSSNEILEKFLLHAMRVVGSSSAAVLRQISGTEHDFVVIAEHGEIVQASEWPDLEITRECRDITRQDRSGVIAQVVGGQDIWVKVDDDLKTWAPGAADFHRRAGHTSFTMLPFYVKQRYAGYFGLAMTKAVEWSPLQRAAIDTLRNQAAVSLSLYEMTQEIERSAAERERQRATERRAAELAKANEAMQETTNALALASSLDEIVPTMLRIVTRTFGAGSSGFYEVDADGRIFLRYWFLEGQVLTIESLDTISFDEEDRRVFTRLTSGFTVNVDYLGASSRKRSEPNVIDHKAGTSEPMFDHWVIKRGWSMELNVPLMVGEVAIGALTLYRAGPVYTETEIALAVALTRQLTLAVQAVKLSEEARESAVQNAIAQERELAAQQRADELAKVNQALRRGAEQISSERSVEAIVQTFLIQSVQTVQAAGGAVMLAVPGEAHTFRTEAAFAGSLYSREQIDAEPYLGRFPELTARDWRSLFSTLKSGRIVPVPIEDTRETFPESYAYHSALGHRMAWNVPLLSRDRVEGFLGFAFCEEKYPTQFETETLTALAQQVVLALELTRLAEEARETAITRERELATRQRAAELEQTNHELALRSRLLATVAEISTFLTRVPDLDAALPEALGRVGTVGSLSRVLLLLERPSKIQGARLEHHVVAEWCAPGIGTHADFGLSVILSTDAAHLLHELRSGKSFWRHVNDIDQPLRSHFERLQIKQTGCIPLFLDNAYAGVLAFDNCVEGRSLGNVHLDALTAAANAVAAALQGRLDADKLAHERERAAEGRAVELTKANESLRRGVEGLLSARSTKEILTGLLKEAVHVSGASSGAVLRRVGGSEFSYVAIFADNLIRSAEDILRSGTDAEMRHASRLDPTGHFAALARGEARWRLVSDPLLQEHLARSVAFHRSSGNRLIYDAPYGVGQEVGGYLGLAFHSEAPPSRSVCETIRALSNQVGLALEFRRISTENERAALQNQRNAFARDLHDTLAQGFTGILMQLGSLEQSTTVPPAMTPYLNRIDELARTNLAEARRTVEELRFLEDARETFTHRLSAVASSLCSAFGARVEVEFSGEESIFDPYSERELLLITQEALTNAIKHAKTQEIGLKVFFQRDTIQIRVWDNGAGFSRSEDNESPGHYGMRSMQERAEQIGASLTVITEKGYGTEVVISWRSKRGDS